MGTRGWTWATVGLLALGACVGVVSEPGESPGDGPPLPPLVDPTLAWESGARRLSQAELDNTLRDLLGDDTAPATRLLMEDEFRPYDNDIGTQMASEALVTALEVMATEVARNAMADTTRRDTIVGCTPTGPDDAACLRQFVEDFLPKAFRRPVPAEEVDRYMALQAFATEDNPYVDNDFYTAVELVIRSVLQDPELLYRIETGTPTSTVGVLDLDGWEIATRIAFLIWGSTPDEELLAAAESGELLDPGVRRSQAMRMLADDKARRQLYRFHAMWLGYRTIPHDAALVAAFDRETTALIDRVVFDEPGDYMRFFLLDETFVDDTLATHYGLPSPAGGEGWVSYAGTERSGILGHGSLLSAFGKFSDTSPTQRGILVRTRLMCQDIPPPPPTVDTDQEPGGMDAVCKFDRYAEHRDQSTSCASCHERMDSIGFGLENYDMAGRYRDADDGLPECIIAGEGEISELDPGTFNGPAELAALLDAAGFLDACTIQQYFTYAIGRDTTEREADLLVEMTDDFRGSGHDFVTFVLDFVGSERFARRAEETVLPEGGT